MDKLVEKIKLRNLDKIYEYRQELYKEPILKDLFLEVTSRCNARCEHCGSSCENKMADDEISAEELKKVLLDISKKYDAKDILLNVTGENHYLEKIYLK